MSISSANIHDAFEQGKDPYGFFSKLGELILDEFASIRLIGEIERKDGRKTYELLKDCLKKILSQASTGKLDSVFKLIPNKFRAVMSLYFVWSGIFSYGEEQGHELWPHIFEGLGFIPDQATAQRLRFNFIQCLIENDLELFPKIEGHPFVTRILLHGLIPGHHIERFIHEFIFDAISQPKTSYESAQTMIEKWNHSELNVPKPIKRFLQYGSPTNVDVVERFLEMALRWADDDQEIWWQWGLPKYMVDAFRKCLRNNPTTAIRKTVRSSTLAKPYLLFNYTRESQPEIIIPPHKVEKGGRVEITYRDLKNIENLIITSESLSNESSWTEDSNYKEIMHFPTGPYKNFEIKFGNLIHRILYSHPEGESGNKVPLYIFSSISGKAINYEPDKGIPNEIILIFPKKGKLEITGGSFLSERIDMYGKWEDWNYKICFFEGNGFLQYSGPDYVLKNDIQDKIPFKLFGQESIEPTLRSQQKEYPWLKSDDEKQIIFNPNGLHIIFNEQSFLTWRHGVGRLIRLDTPNDKIQNPPFRLSEAKKSGNERIVEIPGIDKIAPGLYEISLRGAIGVAPISLPFIYLPLLSATRNLPEDLNPIAEDFLLEFYEPITLLPFENTETSSSVSNRISVKLKEERADAYCALKIFAESSRPCVILLERSDIRWVRHSESGLLDWPYWRTMPEIIPIQRLDELRDSRVLIEATMNYPNTHNSILTSNDKLKITFQGMAVGSNIKKTLMSYIAPKFNRRIWNLWVINLKQFSDQLKDVNHFQEANILIDSGHESGNVTLFTLQRYPEYKKFKIISLNHDHKSERIQLSWEDHPNEPRNKRILKIHPFGQNENLTIKEIPDGQRPPLTLNLEPANQAKLWSAQIDIAQGRFFLSRSNKEISTSKARWMRIPPDWYDWLEWANLAPSQYPEYLSCIENISEKVNLQLMPWSYFLHKFYHCKTMKTCEEMRLLLGNKFLDNALPLTKGSFWEVKKDSRSCLTLRIDDSSIECSDNGLRCFENYSPFLWTSFPIECEIKLVMEQGLKYLGPEGTVWIFRKNADTEKPLMVSEWGGNLDLDIWLDDAIGDSAKRILQARLPLQSIWDAAPHLPLINNIKQRDPIFIMENKSDEGFNTIFSRLQSDKDSQEQAYELVDRWDTWSNASDVNPLLRRMIRGRLENSRINTITGSLAFILRLKANGYESSLSKGGVLNNNTAKTLEKLLMDSDRFIKSNLPQAFLRDLIISEIIISWYWNRYLLKNYS